MEQWQKELIQHLFDSAERYYTEECKDEQGDTALRIPENQHEKKFIQEVFVLTGNVLGLFDNEEEV